VKVELMPLVVGVPGTALSADEISVLERVRPAGIILFSRNIESAEQTRRLVANFKQLEPRPFVSVDLEGGLVNRLSAVWGDLPTPSAAGAAGERAVRALGEAAGAACRNLSIDLDLAPAVDLSCPGGCLCEQERCLSDDPDRVGELAKFFVEGLAEWGVTGCAKHFPGLGAVPGDTHTELPVLDLTEEELQRQLSVFEELGPTIPVVMMGHVVVPGLGDSDRPASLSRTVVEQAIKLPGSPVVITDDLEMGALDSYGSMAERVVLAIQARNHGILICNAFDRLEPIMAHLTELGGIDSTISTRMQEMSARMGTLRTEVRQRAAAVPEPSDSTVEELWEKARCEAG
jgi:beta-N-acetylhexosaminidase